MMTGGGQRRQPAGQGRQGQEQGPGRSVQIVMRNLWFVNGDGKIDCLQVRAGISDGSSTEIISEEEFEGRQVILREKI